MQCDADAVQRLLAMLEPQPPAAEEAARLATLTGSWPELLAHLLLRRGSFAIEPEIDAALRAPAERFRGGALNRRPSGRAGATDLRRQERSHQALEMAIAAVLAAERQCTETLAAADAALRDHVLARPRHGFDLHRRIGPAIG